MDSFQYATGDALIVCNSRLTLDGCNGLNLQLATKFSSLYVGCLLRESHYNSLRLFGTRFTSLTNVELSIEDQDPHLPFTMLVRCLLPLTQLISLKIVFESHILGEPLPDLSPIPLVPFVHLDFFSTSHRDTERLHLAQLFPNLQVLYLSQEIEDCVDCGLMHFDIFTSGFKYPPNDKEKDLLNRIERCIHLTREPFRACAKLHTVKLNGNVGFGLGRDLINANEL